MIRSQAATTAVAVDIRGARGPNAAIINGIYEPTDEISSGWPIYRKRGDAGKWLEYFVAANKWYIKATTDKGRAKVWLRLGSDPPTRPELSTGVCEVWDGERWVVQSSITIFTAKRRRDEDRRLGIERRASAVSVDIRGAVGPSASSINGIYDCTDEICGGWPVYQKRGDSEKWLEHHATTNEWYVKPTADRNRAEGWMCLGSDPPTRPELSRGLCEVWNGERWTRAETVTVLVAQLAFKTPADLDLYCLQEAKLLYERMRESISKSFTTLNIQQTEQITEGNRQIDRQIEDLTEKIAKVKG
jgi:hypothetical protein